jgi:hypothetical protein
MNRPFKIKIALLAGFMCSLAVLIGFNVTANPSFGSNPYMSGCHRSTGYQISANVTSFTVKPGKSFSVYISANGTAVEVEAIAGAVDNNLFEFAPASIIASNSSYDLDTGSNAVGVIMTITAPSQPGNYKIMILGRDSRTDAKPNLAYVELSVTVLGTPSWAAVFVSFLINDLFNHMYVYLGGAAVTLLALGTLLYKLDAKRFTRIHGLLAGSAFILTTINVILVIPAATAALAAITTINIWHLIHILVGIVGYAAGAVAMLTGLGGLRWTKIGYVALICWSFNLVFGGIIWGFNT